MGKTASPTLVATFIALCCGSAVAAPAPKVLVTPVVVSQFAPPLTLTGTVQATTVRNLSFESGGRVLSWDASVGDHVKAGEVLASLDPAQHIQAIAAAQAEIDAAEAQLVQSRAQLERVSGLVAQGNATAATLESAAVSVRNSLEAVAAATANEQVQQRALSELTILAPRDGVVVARNIDAGQIVQPGQTAFVLAEDGGRDAVFDVHEAALIDMATLPEISQADWR